MKLKTNKSCLRVLDGSFVVGDAVRLKDRVMGQSLAGVSE